MKTTTKTENLITETLTSLHQSRALISATIKAVRRLTQEQAEALCLEKEYLIEDLIGTRWNLELSLASLDGQVRIDLLPDYDLRTAQNGPTTNERQETASESSEVAIA